ncbi:hypothetical protein Taro_021345, partial [Colocasia esculenta]|nr:hypothetical protein [Colocasia esculenta]
MAQHTTLSSTTHKLSTMAQTTTRARRLQIEHDGSNHTSKCVDTIGNFVDTTGIVFKLGFWDSDLVSTPQGTVSTPQADCVDTTDYCFRIGFWDSEL